MSIHTLVGDSMSTQEIPSSPADQNTEAATLDSHHHTVDVENPASELKQETAHHHTPPPSIDTSQSTEAFKEIIQAAKFGDLSRIKNIIDSLPPQDFQMNPESSVNTVLLNSTAVTEGGVDTVIAISPFSQQAPTSNSSSGEEPKTGGNDVVKELIGPPPSQPRPVAQLTSTVPPAPNSSTAQLAQPLDLSTCTEVNLSVTIWNNAGDLLPISLSHPDYPPIVLQLKTDPPAPYGNTISLNFTPEWVLKRLNDMLALNPSLGTNGTPIIMSFSISTNRPDAPPQSASQQQQSLPLIQSANPPPSRTIALPVQAAQVETVNVTPTIIQHAPPSQPPSIKPLPGTRKMRPIAPKPPASSNTMSAGLAGLSSIRSSGGRNARKIVSTTPVTISSAAPIAPNPSLNAAVTLIPSANLNSRGAGNVSSSSNINTRNRNRRKNTTTTNVGTNVPLITIATLPQMPNSIPVAITNNPPTAIIPQTGGYMMDSSGNIIAADSTTVTGGFMQPIMHTGVSNGTGAQIFTPAGQLLVNGPNGSLIPMAMLPPVEARPSDAETGDLHQQNSYQTLLVHADGSSAEGYAQQVYFRSDGTATTNGTGTQQFIMTHQGYQATNQEFQMQPFQTTAAGQPTEFIQSNGGGAFIIDGSCYMQYYGGQVQPVESVEIRGAPGEEEEEDILDTAMRVAREGCSDNEVVNLNQFAEDGASNTGPMMNDFMQQQSASNVNPDAEYADQQQQIEDLPGSTGDAKIDALLAEAALVSSVNGVGDDQSAVSVPVTSLLGTRVGNTESATNETPLNAAAVTSDNNTNDEFPQALYDSFANFNSTVIQGDNLPTASNTNAFNYMSQEVNLDTDFCGTTTVDLDVSSSQNDADSFIKNLATQVDEMSAEFSAAAAKGEVQNHDSSEQNQPTVESVSFVEHADGDGVVPHFDETGDDHQGTSHHQVDDMEDILRAVDDDVDDIFLNRDYDVDGFGLLDPSSPLQVPDDLTEHNAPESGNPGLLHPADDMSVNDSLLPPELTLQSVSVFESSPPPPVAATSAQNPPSPIKKTLPEDSDDDSDSSGSELDFLPSRANRKSNEKPPPLPPVVSAAKSIEPQIQYPSSPLSSPQPTRKSPRRSPRQSTPRRKSDQRSSTPSGIPLSPLRRSTRRSNNSRQASENSSTPVSPNLRRSLRSSAAAVSKRIEDDDDLATALMLSDSEPTENPSSDAARNPDATFETEPLLTEDRSIHHNQESSQLQSSPRNAKETSFSSPLTDSPYRHPWFLGFERPKSFGLANTPEVSAPVPVNNIPEIGMELELKDNPVLQSGTPFWGNTTSTDNTNTTDGEDEEDNDGKQQGERRPQDSVGTSTDDSDTDSILSLQAAVRAGSFALNVSFSSPLTLPRDDNTFSRFAASPSLQSFDTLAVVPSSTSRPHSNPPPSVVDCANNSPAASDQAAISSPENEDSSEGTITPNSCIPDPANLSFSEILFPPKFPSPAKISTNPLPILQNSAASTSFSAIAEAASNPPKMAEETQAATSQEQVVVVEENMSGDTEHLPVQSVIVPSTSLVSPAATMVATATEGAGRGIMVADDSAPAVEIIDLSSPPPSPFKEPLKMKISLSSIRSHHHRHHKEKKKKDKNKKKENEQAVTTFKRSRSIEETGAAGSNCEPTPPKVGKLIISRVGDSYHRQPIASDDDNDGGESFHSEMGSNYGPLPSIPSPIRPAYMKPLGLTIKPKRGRGRPVTKGITTGTRGRPRGSRGIGRGVVQVRTRRTDAVPHPQQQWPSPPSAVDENKASSPELESLEETLHPTEPPSNAGRKFFSSSKEDRRSSAITKNRSWRPPYGTTVRKRGRYSGSLLTRDRRNSQSQQNQQQSVSTTHSTIILPPSATTLPPTESLRVRIRMNTNESSSGQSSENSQAGTTSELLQATEGSTILTTSNPDEEHYQNEIANLETQSRPQSQGGGGAIFFVAPEAETFVDKNQARVRVVVNRAACLANGIDPGLSDDDDSEDDDNNEDDEGGGGGNTRRFSPNAPHPPHRPPSSNPPRSHGSVEQHQRSSYRIDHHSAGQPQNYSSSRAPSFNHQPTAAPVFTPTRCDMTVSSSAAATHQHVPQTTTTTTTRTSGDAHGSARSSSTASGSLPAPSTISPAPFTLPQTNNNEVATDNNEPNFYQRQQQQASSGRQFAEMRHPPPSPQASTTFQQQRSQEAFAAAYAAMFANSYLLMPPYGAYGQREQQPSRDGHLESHSTALHHHHSSSQQDDHQRIASSYSGGEGSSANEAHQNQHSYSLASNFTNRIPERDALNYYAWNAQHQYHQANAMRSTERYSYPSASSPFPGQNSSVNHPGTASAGAASQWYQGVAHSSEQPGVVTQPPPNSTSNYPQLDDPVVAAAVAARYRLSPFSRLS